MSLSFCRASNDEDWYAAYKDLEWDREDPSGTDKRLPRPSPNQKEMIAIAAKNNYSTLVIEDLNINRRELLDITINKGLPMLRILANISQGF